MVNRRPSQARIRVVEAKRGATRRRLLEEMGGTGASVVSCDFELGGPWAGVNALFASFTGELLKQFPELANAYTPELVHVLPALKKTLKLPYASLTDTAPPEERVRNYAADRAFRLVHGLIDLVDCWKTAVNPGTAWHIVCDDYDRAGAIGKRFFRELMRRRGEALDLSLTVAVDPGKGAEAREWFDSTSGVEVIHAAIEDEKPVARLEPAEAAHWATFLEGLVGDDAVAAEVHVTELIRLWGLAGDAERLLHWRWFATEHYLHLGLYEDACRYTDGLLHLADETAQQTETQRLWILIKTLSGYMGAQDASQGLRFVEEQVLPCLEHPNSRQHVDLFFLTAMMYARYQKPRDTAKGEMYLDRGLALLDHIACNEEDRHFCHVFNRNGVAMIRTFQGRLQEAIDLCREGAERLNKHLGSEKHRLHRSVLIYNMAQVYFAMGAHEEAIAHYTAVISLDPDYSEYYNERGNILLRVGRLEEARADYLDAIRLSPPYPEVHTNLGQCLRALGEFEQAVASYTRALDLAPDQVLAMSGRAKAYEELGLRNEAIAGYGAALELDPKQWDAFASRGVLHYEAGELEASLRDLDSAVRIAPEVADLRRNRSVVLAELGRLEEAARDVETVLLLEPNAEDAEELRTRFSAIAAA